jgi:hypothetical protein
MEFTSQNSSLATLRYDIKHPICHEGYCSILEHNMRTLKQNFKII